MIQFQCKWCGAPMEAPDSQAGQSERCGACGRDCPVPACDAAAPPRPKAVDAEDDLTWQEAARAILTFAAIVLALWAVFSATALTINPALLGAIILLLLRPRASHE